ncbi:energy-coupling factor transporter transmembrane protein EcfT [Desulfosarcina alkanivorans]|uniref:Energy-coupling factor transporter transmembrane protein EcfT n=1 Tax=Desulfosarcina alkanivorans TaxID=571177 RepID=A0A5K7YCF0_9BACT|nr:energy-coupling factor transporter transmembrane component T [Desulfosarcina alkanivorans]BBO66095.1 energy-coupling factor transporter transmembrane protein EcfT [Desulfosarcina alkanivorans]
MGELTTIGFSPGDSLLHRLDPRTKQALLMGFSMMSLMGGLVFLTSLSAVMICCLNVAGLRPARLLAEIRYFLFFLFFVFGLRSVTFDHGWVPSISLDLAEDALVVCWRLLLVVCMGIVLMATTRTADIRAALVWFLRPIPLVNERMAATMVGLVVRFLPVILFQAAEISDAQRARGIERRRNPMVRLMRFTIPLFRRVFLSADELAVAMQARCYHEHRTLPELVFKRRDALAAGAALLLFLTVFFP